MKYWIDENQRQIARLFRKSAPEGILRLRYTRERWARARGRLDGSMSPPPEELDFYAKKELVPTSVSGIRKAIVRGLDKINCPDIVAVGMIDAWYEGRSWALGASIIISGVTKSQLYDNLPRGSVDIEPVVDIKRELRSLSRRSKRAKLMPPLGAVVSMTVRRKGEYLSWLDDMMPNARLIRYGCDANCSKLQREVRPSKPLEWKKRPFPKHLVSRMYGNHAWNCQCKACGGYHLR